MAKQAFFYKSTVPKPVIFLVLNLNLLFDHYTDFKWINEPIKAVKLHN